MSTFNDAERFYENLKKYWSRIKKFFSLLLFKFQSADIFLKIIYIIFIVYFLYSAVSLPMDIAKGYKLAKTSTLKARREICLKYDLSCKFSYRNTIIGNKLDQPYTIHSKYGYNPISYLFKDQEHRLKESNMYILSDFYSSSRVSLDDTKKFAIKKTKDCFYINKSIMCKSECSHKEFKKKLDEYYLNDLFYFPIIFDLQIVTNNNKLSRKLIIASSIILCENFSESHCTNGSSHYPNIEDLEIKSIYCYESGKFNENIFDNCD